MKYEIKDFRNENGNKYVGFMITYEDIDNENHGRTFCIDKQVKLSDGKSDDSYIDDALELSKNEIEEWEERMKTEKEEERPEPEAVDRYVGKEWDISTKSFT